MLATRAIKLTTANPTKARSIPSTWPSPLQVHLGIVEERQP